MPRLSSPGLLYKLRLHWKKSTAAAIFLVGGGYLGADRYRAHRIRQTYCRRAKALSEECVAHPTEECKRIMVFLNPAVDNRNPRKLFQKNVAPVLYLAGLDVTVVESEYDGHLRTLMGYMDKNMGGIVVAGGDGSVQEVVTGLLRRTDESVIANVPLGIIPMGKTNSLAGRLFQSQASQVQQQCEAALTVVLGKTSSVDVMSLKSESAGQPAVFALGCLRWGLFRDTDNTVDKYWWSGRLRGFFAYFWPTLQASWPRIRQLTVSVPEAASASPATSPADSSNVDASSSSWLGRELQTSAFEISTPLMSSENSNSLTVKVWPDSVAKGSFIGYGWRKHVLRRPVIDLPIAHELSCAECRIQIPDDEISWFTIDGEMFEAQTVQVKLLRNKLKVFVPDTDGQPHTPTAGT